MFRQNNAIKLRRPLLSSSISQDVEGKSSKRDAHRLYNVSRKEIRE